MSPPPSLLADEGSAPTSARENAYRRISEAILAGEFAEGQFLDESSLARAVGTSRTPVREALHRLQAERYVDLVPRRGAQVRTLTATEMQEIYDARLIIESAALAKICRHERGAPASAPEVLDAIEEAGSRRDWSTFARLDQQFHQSIVEHGGNGVLTDLYLTLRPRHIRLAIRTITEAPHRRETIEREHRELLAAMDAHDADEAARVLNEHLRFVPELIDALPG